MARSNSKNLLYRKQVRFTPQLVPSLIFVIVFGIFLSVGFRYSHEYVQEKRIVQQGSENTQGIIVNSRVLYSGVGDGHEFNHSLSAHNLLLQMLLWFTMALLVAIIYVLLSLHRESEGYK